MLFQKAIEAHEYRIKPTLITCVSAEGMEQILRESLEYGNDANDAKAMGESL